MTIGASGSIRFSQSQITFEDAKLTLRLRYLGDWQSGPALASGGHLSCYAVYAIQPPTRAEIRPHSGLCGSGTHVETRVDFLLVTTATIINEPGIAIFPLAAGTTFDATGFGEHYCGPFLYFQP